MRPAVPKTKRGEAGNFVGLIPDKTHSCQGGTGLRVFHSSKLLKSLNILSIGLFAASLLGCGAMMGLTNRADGDGAVQQGGALDDIAQGGVGGGLGVPGRGGAGGSMTGTGGIPDSGSDPGDGGSPPTGGGGAGPFDDVGGGGTGNVPTGSGGECSGSVCSTDTPSGVLFGAIKVSVRLNPDPDKADADCNTLWPPKEEREVCHLVQKTTKPGAVDYAAGLLVGQAWALPRDVSDLPDAGELELGDVVCTKEPYQPPIDPKDAPQVGVKATRPFFKPANNEQPQIYEKILTPSCTASGKWLAETETLKVPFGPYPDSNNTWEFQIDARYPENDTWVSKGTRTLTVKCTWGQSGSIDCAEVIPSPLGEVHANPADHGGVFQQAK